VTRFKVFYGDPADVERNLNDWAAALPAGTRIRRTQLAAARHTLVSTLYALVNYDEPAEAARATVHFLRLHHGCTACTACGLTGLASDWPLGNTWSDDWAHVTCAACAKKRLVCMNCGALDGNHRFETCRGRV
jgi:hypothetical protein